MAIPLVSMVQWGQQPEGVFGDAGILARAAHQHLAVTVAVLV